MADVGDGVDVEGWAAALERVEALVGRRLDLADRGLLAPIQVGKRWVVERTHSWRNDVGKICRCTERRQGCVDASLVLAAAVVTMRALVRAA